MDLEVKEGKSGSRTAAVQDGEDENNKGGCAADRPELFQKGDAVQAREVVAGDCGTGDCAGVDWLAFPCGRWSCVFERTAECSACSAWEGLCCVSRPARERAGQQIFGECDRFGLFSLS